ncbi:Cof-type HAD-IIB family hydrolase [Bacillus canaveralius]|uniref:Cof-type HAD-IIB family hydrolase n=1 Tax=Bacillus canaveralius TaxID=1403243 RepID=A0A2N5GNF9_9BACI|nr:Cof-type HAD-IIB family hydrolase [Bacillus canaveralius]PLR84045.1 Cof-type HAD-IIB family hydrolase [Bacillus canaveralius]PLR96310.1 Cof-type HAD-IIB family hydrolase [Bacillus canaveralius]RSK53503.1 Cof-type HAD-IIB family hydrolase [Bacillus canaveralius]
MSKIVFFDIDGTLLDHDKKLPITAKKAVKELQNSGVYVAIATGRAPFMFESLREELGIESFVSFNGQYVVFEGEVIYKNPLNNDEIQRLVQQGKENNHPLVFMNHGTMKATVKHHRYIEDSLMTLKFPHPEVDKSFYQNREIYQSLLFIEEEDEALYLEQFPELRFIRWHPFSMDVLPAGGSKAEGIKKMIERLGFQIENVFAFGDGLNDIEMIQTVGTGVAMGNAEPALKQYADYITKDVAEDGIQHGLKHLQLI